MHRRTEATYYLASIREEHFETFKRNLAGDLAGSYQVWQQNLAKRVAALQRRGSTVQLIDVDPEGFAEHCARMNIRQSLQTLNGFSLLKATGSLTRRPPAAVRQSMVRRSWLCLMRGLKAVTRGL